MLQTLKKHRLALIFGLALLFRLLLVPLAYHGDLNNNWSWGKVAVTHGLNGFYGSSDSDDWEYRRHPQRRFLHGQDEEPWYS